MKIEHQSIAFVIGSLVLGGAEKQLYLLAQHLQKRGWNVTVITLHPDFNDYWEQPLRALGIPVFGVSTDFSKARRFLIISGILRENHCQIVHSWSFYTNFYTTIASKFSDVKVRLGSERANQNCSLASLGKWKYDLSLLGLDGIVANSQSAAMFLRRYKRRLKVWVVPNGLVMPVQVKTKFECRARLNIPVSAFVIGSVGSLESRKNFGGLIDAIKELTVRDRNVFLAIIGDGPLRNELQKQAEKVLSSKGFLFTGAMPNAADWMEAFDVFCLPSSDQEGMPNVLMEASAAGLPVVATKVGAVSDIIEDAKTGLLVPLEDVKAMADALDKLLHDPALCLKLGQAGQAKMKSQYSVESMVDSMIDIYSSLLERR
jgi:glycosyltransferase involved in cell wall biosynthesis